MAMAMITSSVSALETGVILYADIVLDDEGYTYNKEANFKYKLVSFDKEVTDTDGVITIIKEHLMCFWSKDEELYQKIKTWTTG